jgi:hypothetical protein
MLPRPTSAHLAALFSRTCRVRWQREADRAGRAGGGREIRRVADAHRAAFGRVESIGRELRGGRKRHDNLGPTRWAVSLRRLSDVTGPLAGRRSQKNPKAACPEIPRALFRSLAIWSSTPASLLAARDPAPRVPRTKPIWAERVPRTKPIWAESGSPNEADLS